MHHSRVFLTKSLIGLSLAVAVLLLGPMTSFAAAGAKGLDGVALYARDCASCHRSLEKTDLIGGRSASRIKSAIQVFGIMNSLKTLSDAEIAAVAAALAPEQAGQKLAQQNK